MLSSELNGALSPANCARKIAGPLIVVNAMVCPPLKRSISRDQLVLFRIGRGLAVPPCDPRVAPHSAAQPCANRQFTVSEIAVHQILKILLPPGFRLRIELARFRQFREISQ